MKSYLKLYGLIASLDMGLPKLLLLSLCMVKRLLPVEVNLGANRLAKQNDLNVDTYYA
jgi:hypothetical protein